MPKIKVYTPKSKSIKEVADLSQLYDAGYYHGEAYEDYTFQKLRSHFIHKINSVKKFCYSGRLLDVGCALGYFVKLALNEGFDAYGVDFSEYAIKQARKLVGQRVKRADVEKEIPFQENSFDIITAWDLLEHLRDPYAFLRRIAKFLKKDGFLFVSTLNYGSLMSKIMKDRWSFITPGYHQTHTITVSDIADWAYESRLTIVKIDTFGITLNSFSDKIHLPILKQIAQILEIALRFEIDGILKLLKPLHLGDTIYCVLKRAW
ncbi:MAG: class I SAM-dependent methyltransferase [Candidatus Bathyarchaeia archaeon]